MDTDIAKQLHLEVSLKKKNWTYIYDEIHKFHVLDIFIITSQAAENVAACRNLLDMFLYYYNLSFFDYIYYLTMYPVYL